jgi:hypothetical protein
LEFSRAPEPAFSASVFQAQLKRVSLKLSAKDELSFWAWLGALSAPNEVEEQKSKSRTADVSAARAAKSSARFAQPDKLSVTRTSDSAR